MRGRRKKVQQFLIRNEEQILTDQEIRLLEKQCFQAASKIVEKELVILKVCSHL